MLYRPFLETRLSGERISLQSYAARRAFRIIPAYWVALSAVALFGNGGSTVRENPMAYFGFAQVYSAETRPGGIGPAWTLDVEATFYIALPVVAAALAVFAWGSRRRLVIELALVVVATAAAFAWTSGLPPGNVSFGVPELFWLPRFLGHFALGMALATIAVKVDRGGSLAGLPDLLIRYPTIAWIMVPVAFTVSAKTDIGTAARDLSDGLGAAALLWPAVLNRQGAIATRVLSWRPLVLVGLVSYGIYLYHFAVITRLDSVFPSGAAGTAAWAFASFVGAIALGAMSWVAIEKPAVRMGRRLGGPFLRAVSFGGKASRPPPPGESAAP